MESNKYSIKAARFDGQSSRRYPAEIFLDGNQLLVVWENGQQRYPFSSLSMRSALGLAPRTLFFPDGSFCEVPNSQKLETFLPQAMPAPITRFERSTSCVLGSVLFTLFFLVAVYIWGLPALAKIVAHSVPHSWNVTLGESVLKTLDKRNFVEPSNINATRQQELMQAFSALHAHVPAPPWKLHFRTMDGIANAFALPSGDIVITDALVKNAGSDEEILAILCHELGHVVKRHGLCSLLQSTGVTVLVAAIFGDMSTVVSATAGLLDLSYSRDMEWEADNFAIEMLRANHKSPIFLANALETLQKSLPQHAEKLPNFFSTHPDLQKRIENAKVAASRKKH